ncbi:ABC transporter substrate-binding protein [Deinococcus sp. AJ005]|uniref:ABC transporter substrate-binding protein n=1 Tax=Deinococcus sp. AJ005 TaxID=2652443 RepID=UPI001CF6D17A|nr:ABC transporter substrate-binding protein [Deinococcus sp. AJ005]
MSQSLKKNALWLTAGLLATLSVSAQAQNLPRAQTLIVSGWQYDTPTSFNPVSPAQSAWPVGNTNSGTNVYELVYETLMTFNSATGKLEPLLATGYTQKGNVITVKMQPAAKWQDSKALTAADVVYSFELGKREALSYSNLWDYVSSVKAPDARTVVITLNPKKLNPGLVINYLGQIVIVPQHIFAAVEKEKTPLAQFTNLKPVGSGPYKVSTYNAERVVAIRDDNYWGKSVWGLPAPKYILHPIFKGNDSANLALSQGNVDVSQSFIPEIWKLKDKGVGTWLSSEPYYLPGSIPLLVVNTTKKGLDNPLVRRAIAMSINYPLIAKTAMSNYSVPANASLLLPSGNEKNIFNAAEVKKNGWSYNPQGAVDIMEKQLKAKKGGDGIYVLPDGTRLGPWKLAAPNGWTDWNQALSVVASSGKAVGIDLRTDFPQQSVWQTNLNTGDFDLALNGSVGVSAAGPWPRFQAAMDNRDTPKIGENAFSNYGRYSNSQVAPLLDKAAAATSAADQKNLYGQLDAIFQKDVPAIPLMYRPYEFYEFNTAHWTGFPTSADPYAAPQNAQAGVRMLYKIKPR